MDINAICDGSGDESVRTILREGTAENMKRFSEWNNLTERDWTADDAEDPYRILELTETKTTWHPMGV